MQRGLYFTGLIFAPPREHSDGPVNFLSQVDSKAPSKLISSLEQSEKQLALEYGAMTGAEHEVDSAGALQEAIARAAHKNYDPLFPAYQSHQHYFRSRFRDKSDTLPFLEKQSSASIVESPLNVGRSPFWAVIIGIDAYDSYPLRGCVSDALLVAEYLQEDVGVPQEQIQLLLGSEHASCEDPSYPSRVNIIKALLGLISNPSILPGDNIIIYFSGHGAGYSSSDYFHSDTDSDEADESPRAIDRSIEAICPIDRDTIDASGLHVPDVSDREINGIFQKISRSKGHRITVILDCCHSGRHTRHFPDPGTRTIPPLPRASLRRMLDKVNESLGHEAYQEISSREWRPDMSSYVVLTACKDYQVAKEVQNEAGYYNGIFTQGLIGTLRSGKLSQESTYVDLLFSLPQRRGQTPVVAGKHKRESLWYKV
ncbi:caspase domain-containing protein [Desarmillaria tabescens]|uniref:Caspase domain-containing protein n=1 Tax=Armillaria tabescens TaxID=1929756 RepID=A0AA39JC59_ARMTA|nr:caspase domain-containing protein [Desarmillaria tabescens]KAK0439290.1 caspase domain-containing protein [Desarmillaria tabescens]